MDVRLRRLLRKLYYELHLNSLTYFEGSNLPEGYRAYILKDLAYWEKELEVIRNEARKQGFTVEEIDKNTYIELRFKPTKN